MDEATANGFCQGQSNDPKEQALLALTTKIVKDRYSRAWEIGTGFRVGLEAGEYRITGQHVVNRVLLVELGRAAVGQSEDAGGDLTETLFDETGHWRDDPRVFGDQPSASLERQEFWKIFRGCLETLPEGQADAFTLREFDERSSEEICKDLDISPSNLWVLLHRARLRLANCMKARWQAEGEPNS